MQLSRIYSTPRARAKRAGVYVTSHPRPSLALASVVAGLLLVFNLRATVEPSCSNAPVVPAAAKVAQANASAGNEPAPRGGTNTGRSRKASPKASQGREPKGPPNVVVFVTDDQRFDSMSGMPQTLRWMSKGGTTFTDAFVTTPLCCPSRTTVQTGLYAHNHGVQGNEDGVESIFPAGQSVEHYLKGDGYLTGLFGKFLNGWPLSEPPPDVDKWAFFPRVALSAYQGGVWNVQGHVRVVHSYATTFIRRHAVSFLDQADEGDDSQPWFLYLAPPAPHLPAIPEPKYENAPTPPFVANAATCEADRSDKPTYVRNMTTDMNAILGNRRRMLQSLMSVDDLVGTVFRTLKAQGELHNTLAIFLSDNGYLWGEHGLTEKSLPYTPSIRVPMMVRWPGHFAPGAKDHRLAANLDLTPTILDAAGITPATPLDGRSLLGPYRRTRLLTEFWKLPGYYVPTWASIRTQTYQYIEYYGQDGSTIGREFYDLVADPLQLDNLLDGVDPGSPQVVRLHELLARDRVCEGDGCP